MSPAAAGPGGRAGAGGGGGGAGPRPARATSCQHCLSRTAAGPCGCCVPRHPGVLREASPLCEPPPHGGRLCAGVRVGDLFLPTPCGVSPLPSLLWLLLPEPCPQEVSRHQVGTVHGPHAQAWWGSARARAGRAGAGGGGPARAALAPTRPETLPSDPWAVGGARKPSPVTFIPGCGRSLRAKVGARLTCTSCRSELGGCGGWAHAACPAGEPPEGLAGREEEVFFSSFLVTILQLRLWKESRA